jgi:hypothetical protein
MTTERQIAANRRNSQKSTGPRSRGGKSRIGRNAYRHGLSQGSGSIPMFAREVERLARAIVGDTEDEISLERARIIAAAELDLARVRRVKVALIECARVLGEFDPVQIFKSVTEVHRFFNALDRGKLIVPQLKPATAMPAEEPERSAEAVRRALPHLIKLDRYERRASRLRDQAVREIARGRKK